MMQLYGSTTSPYVRRVNITAIETGLIDRITFVPTNIRDPQCQIGQINPLGKIPTLVTGDGMVMIESAIICEYLDGLSKGVRLFPPSGAERWRALYQMAVANGATDAAVLMFLELQRPEEKRSPEWLERQQDKVTRALAVLNQEVASFDRALTIGPVTAACLLGFLDFRLPQLAWREAQPALAAWFARFSERPSLSDTVPHL